VRIDAHHHLWDPAEREYPWMTDAVSPIRRRFDPGDLAPLLRAHAIDGSVLVQAVDSVEETRALLRFAAATPLIAGVVGWVDLTDAAVAETIAELCGATGGDRLAGIRHLVQDEPDPNWLLQDSVQRGLAALEDAGLAYDLLVRPPQIAAAVETARGFPRMRLVVDHLAKPPIASGEVGRWAALMEPFAEMPHVTCKLSGLVTEADGTHLDADQLLPYVRIAWQLFGEHRLMFGSDWPVCLLAAPYARVVELAEETLRRVGASEAAMQKVFGENAVRFYELNVNVEV